MPLQELGSRQLPHGATRAGQRYYRPHRSGHKAWALLAYVLLCRGLPSRQRLAELFFSETDDPLGSLRWNLAELRRSRLIVVKARGTASEPIAKYRVSEAMTEAHPVFLGDRILIGDLTTLKSLGLGPPPAKD